MEEAGGFRAPVAISSATKPLQHRGWKPRFDADVHIIKEARDNKVIANNGSEYDTRFVKPASATTAAASSAIKPSFIERGGSEPIRNTQREALQEFAKDLVEKLRESSDISVGTVYANLSDRQGFVDAAATVRLNKTSLYRNFLSLFPELFKISETGMVTLVQQQRRKLRPIVSVAAPRITTVPVAAPAPKRRLRLKTPAPSPLPLHPLAPFLT